MAGMRITLLTGWLAGIAIAVMLGGVVCRGSPKPT